MSENISEYTTSITGLTCKPLAILSETISPQEMSMVRGGNGAVSGGCIEPDPPIEVVDEENPYPCPCEGELSDPPCPCESEDFIEPDDGDGEDGSFWEDVTDIVEDVWDWLTDDEEEEDEEDEEDEEETEEEEIEEEWP